MVFRFKSKTSYRKEFDKILSTDPIEIFNDYL